MDANISKESVIHRQLERFLQNSDRDMKIYIYLYIYVYKGCTTHLPWTVYCAGRLLTLYLGWFDRNWDQRRPAPQDLGPGAYLANCLAPLQCLSIHLSIGLLTNLLSINLSHWSIYLSIFVCLFLFVFIILLHSMFLSASMFVFLDSFCFC